MPLGAAQRCSPPKKRNKLPVAAFVVQIHLWIPKQLELEIALLMGWHQQYSGAVPSSLLRSDPSGAQETIA